MTAPDGQPRVALAAEGDPVAAAFLDGDAAACEEIASWIGLAAIPFASLLRGGLEDLQQDLLIELGESLRTGRFRGDSSLRTYVRRMTQHRCIDKLRAARRRTWLDVSKLNLPSQVEPPDRRTERLESIRLSLRIAAAAPAACRELWRRILEGENYREMSSALGVTEGTLRVRVARCRSAAVEARRNAVAGNEVRGRATGSSERKVSRGL